METPADQPSADRPSVVHSHPPPIAVDLRTPPSETLANPAITPSLIADAIDHYQQPYEYWLAVRRVDILNRRAAGELLKDIAPDYRITKAAVSSIVGRWQRQQDDDAVLA